MWFDARLWLLKNVTLGGWATAFVYSSTVFAPSLSPILLVGGHIYSSHETGRS